MDGQIEVVNKWVENYLKSYAGDRLKDWSQWVFLVEWCYNSSYYASTKVTPFDVTLQNQDHICHLLKQNISRAQERMKKNVDQKRKLQQKGVGDWVYL